jgi:hypothetical protein
MGDGEPCPKRGPVATIERKQFFRRTVSQSRRDASADVAAGPCIAETLALETEKSHFVKWVRRAQRGIELQAVNNAQGITEKNMLRSQVPMCIDDAPCPHAVGQERSSKVQETPLRAVYAPDQACRHAKARMEQNALIKE